MVCTLFGQKGCQKVQQSRGTTSCRRVFSGQSLEHFDVISMVDKSIDHGNCCRFFFDNNIDSLLRPFPLKFLGKSGKIMFVRKRGT